MSAAGPEKKIDYIELPASDVVATRRFFETVFGWKFEDYGPEYTSFSDGRIAGGFTTAMAGPVRGALLVIYSADLPAMQESIVGAGGKIVKDTFSFPGGKRFHFTDPSGNEMAVWSDV